MDKFNDGGRWKLKKREKRAKRAIKCLQVRDRRAIFRQRSQMHTSFQVPRIYVVDDESALAQMVKHILGLRGYEAEVFDNPRSALEHLKEHPADQVLLITDCVMGSMNGLELIEEFQRQVKQLRTILLSGTITSDFVQKCQVQPDRFLAKPYPADDLLTAVDDLLSRAASPRV